MQKMKLILIYLFVFFYSLFTSVINIYPRKVMSITRTSEQALQPIIEVKEFDGMSLSASEFEFICKTVMAEAGAEPYEGIVAVAQCIKNAMIREGRDFSLIYKEYGYYYQSKTYSDKVELAVEEVFSGTYSVTDEPIICYYNPHTVYSDWHESQDFVIEIGNHRFFKFSGD